MVVSSAVEHIFNETAMLAKGMVSNHLAKVNRASHVLRVRAKERVRSVRDDPKENPKVPKVPKVRTRVKPRKLAYQVWRSETSSETQFLHKCIPLTIPTRTTLGVMMAGVTMNGMMTGVRLDGMRVGIKLVTTPQAHFHLEVWILVS